MNNPNLLGQLAAATPVGSGVLLGGGVVIFGIIYLGVLGWALVMTLISMMADQIQDELDELKNSQGDKNDGEYLEAARKLNERLCLCNQRIRAGDKLLCCPLRLLGKLNLKGCHRKLKRMATRCGISEEPANLVNRSGQKPRLSFSLAGISGFFRRHSWSVHKSKDVATTPNDES
jgi:hypothetical protein